MKTSESRGKGTDGFESASRLRLGIRGAVQGVGFRPHVYRLATVLDLTGWVRNSLTGVQVELEGSTKALQQFMSRLVHEKPALASIDKINVETLPLFGFSGFEVVASDSNGECETEILSDAATCEECRREIFDPKNRRYRYPFTNCTNCGPRYSIVESLPYDRINTTMGRFTMCQDCQQEYEDPGNRRFHAQPNACPTCGPQLELWDSTGKTAAEREEALRQACECIRGGGILALKGLGGFQLIVDAGSDNAVQRLRDRKKRPEKPFALMYSDIYNIDNDCEMTPDERAALTSCAAPIVLIRKRPGTPYAPDSVSRLVAPENPYLAVMLPYTPVHHLLMADLGSPIVATSGNLCDEPICTDEREAIDRLRDIGDLFLVHNRPIAQPIDDSVVRIMAGRPTILRSARGYAPTAIDLSGPVPDCLAAGAQLKNTIGIARRRRAFISQHIGDLESKRTFDSLHKVAGSLAAAYDAKPEIVVCDKHPDYLSTRFASGIDAPCEAVQHHYAHVLSCMTDNGLNPPVLGVSFDGSGLGDDGTIWGGEFLRVDDVSFERVAHLRCFRLPGGDTAIREPRRSALGLLYELFGDGTLEMDQLAPTGAFTPSELRTVAGMLRKGINSPITSSAGRLFDAISSIIGLCQKMSYEGQAAMKLEFAADGLRSMSPYEFTIDTGASSHVVDWELMIRQILADLRTSMSPAVIAARFHRTLAEMVVSVATCNRDRTVVLSGGCFQNRLLTEQTLAGLERAGCDVYLHQRVPPNDGGIALGQLAAVSRMSNGGAKRVSGSTG